MDTETYTQLNASVIDGWVEKGWEWGRPISQEACARARQGEWNMLLTPLTPVPKAWYPPLKGARVLGLACGGAQQMPIFALLGARCTVLDYSEKQLDSERAVAKREGYDIDIVRADMSRPLPFEDEMFDLIFHPVSNCYIEHVLPVWRECHRVLKPGGVLLSGLDNGLCYAFDDEGEHLIRSLPYNPLKNEAQYREAMKNNDGVQFSHTITEQLGGQLEAGLRLTHMYEDTDGESGLHRRNIPCFIATRAVKP